MKGDAHRYCWRERQEKEVSFVNLASLRGIEGYVQLVSNNSLSSSVVLHLQSSHHLPSVLFIENGKETRRVSSTAPLSRSTRSCTDLRSVLHSSSSSGNLSSVSLDESGKDGVGKGELDEVLGDVLLHLVLGESSCSERRKRGDRVEGIRMEVT